jgi:drug/metabolite transporter (DMT)-like permease
MALTQCAASIYQMMRSAIVVITALLMVKFFGKQHLRHHWVSLGIIVTGLFIVGIVGVTMSDDGDSRSQTTFLGVILLLIAQLFTGGQFVTEEKILSGYILDPLLVVGLQGFWGCVFSAILLPIF